MKKSLIILLLLGALVPRMNAQALPSPKDSTVHVIGHAHMDMNWLWTIDETAKMADDNVRQAVAFMKEYPDFTMLLSQASVYRFVEENDPALFKELQKYVAEGRLEPAGGTWTQSDQNLSSGEALSRSFLLAQRYFQEKLGRTAHVGWFPDDFGHIAQLPQMLRLAGMNYYYFMRTSPYRSAFNWEAPDGSTVLAYTSGSYNGNIDEGIRNKLKDYPTATPHALSPTGVGDHGGGPSRAMIEKAHELDAREDYPHVKFTTLEDFYKTIEPARDQLPTHKGEMQFIFEGCYTNVAEIKEMNRKCEQSFYEGEFFNVMNWLDGGKYPAECYKKEWTELLFNEFHDILPGSAIYESNRESVARYYEILRTTDGLRDKAYWQYVDRIPFRKDLGQPVVAFNFQPYEHKTLVEAEVFSYENPTFDSPFWAWGYYLTRNPKPIDIGQGPYATVLVRDAEGNSYPAQVIESKQNPPGARSKVLFLSDDIPAGGYKTFYVDMSQPGVLNENIPFEDNTFDTDYYKIRIDPETGDIVSLIDKASGREFVQEGGRLNTLRIYNERPDGDMTSWLINGATFVEDVVKPGTPAKRIAGEPTRAEVPTPPRADDWQVKITNGPLRATIEIVKTWGRSRFHIYTYIYRSHPRIDYDLDVEWLEAANQNGSPMLRAVFPLKMDDARLWCNVPFDVVERPANGKIAGQETGILNPEDPRKVERRFGQEVPVQKWADVTDGRDGFTLMSRSKYGYCYDNDELRLSLLRCGGNPDPYPNLGRFNIRYAILPHTGTWENGIMAEGETYSLPVFAREPRSMSLPGIRKNLPESQSLISLDQDNVLITGMKQGEDGKTLVVRLCEMQGKETTVRLQLPVRAKAVRKLDLMERPLDGAKARKNKGNVVEVTLRPHEIATLGIKH